MTFEIVKVPGTDLQGTVAKLFKTVLFDCSELQKDVAGFTQDLTGKTTLEFPEVGVIWDTVVVTGHTGSYIPKVFTPDGITAKLDFNPAQTGIVTISPYKQWTTFILARIEDLQVDLLKYYGDIAAANKKTRHIPMMVPLIDMNRSRRVRYAGGGEAYQLVGQLCVYAGSDQGGISAVKNEAAKLFRWIRAFKFKFSQVGIAQLSIDLPQFTGFNGLYEGVIPFTAFLTLADEASNSVVPPGRQTTLPQESLTTLDGGTF